MKGVVHAQVKDGVYAGKNVTIKIGSTGYDSEVYFNEEKLTNVRKVIIAIDADCITTCKIELMELQ